MIVKLQNYVVDIDGKEAEKIFQDVLDCKLGGLNWHKSYKICGDFVVDKKGNLIRRASGEDYLIKAFLDKIKL